jgi:hypothetical protein
MEKYPFVSLIVPIVVPLIRTLTPAIGRGCTEFSSICPWIVQFRSFVSLATADVGSKAKDFVGVPNNKQANNKEITAFELLFM